MLSFYQAHFLRLYLILNNKTHNKVENPWSSLDERGVYFLRRVKCNNFKSALETTANLLADPSEPCLCDPGDKEGIVFSTTS